MRLFLDDFRMPHNCTQYMYKRIGAENTIYFEPWYIVRDYDQFVKAVEESIDKITHVSFDHDLSDEHYDPETWNSTHNYKEKTGLEAAKWMKEFYEKKGKELPIIFVHSMNPVGTQNILNIFI